MAAAAPKVGKGKGKGKIPPWMIAAALGIGLLAFVFLRGKGKSTAAPQETAAPVQTDSSGLTGSQAGTPSSNGAPADSLDAGVLAALGFTLEQIGTQGQALAGIAMNANDNMGYIASTALAGSFALAGQSVQGAYELGGRALELGGATIYQGTPVKTTTTVPTLETGPVAPPAAPAPRVVTSVKTTAPATVLPKNSIKMIPAAKSTSGKAILGRNLRG